MIFFFNNVEIKLPKELASSLKIVLVLSHGQASVERIFSVNNTIMKDNLKSESVTARKVIIDHMRSKELKAHSLPITKNLVHSVKQSRRRYQEFLSQQREESKKNEIADQLELLDANINEMVLRKTSLADFCDSMDKEFLELANKAEKNRDLNLLSKGTALKRKADERRPELLVLQSQIDALLTKKRKLTQQSFH